MSLVVHKRLEIEGVIPDSGTRDTNNLGKGMSSDAEHASRMRY